MKYFISIVLFLCFSISYSQHFKDLPKLIANEQKVFRQNISNEKDSVVTVIVEFVETPLFLSQTNTNGFQKKYSEDFYKIRFEEFQQAITVQSNKLAKNNNPIQVFSTYFKVFFGVALNASSSQIDEIRKLAYIKAIHLTSEVKAHLDKSIPQIRANEVWNKYTVQGEGVTVGIIDTGIDYLHPALGGGFGQGFKVVGGYDFVNNDNDPMDDFGHGTHVAGIVAADGASIKGVAPKAKLLAYKVLDENGRGTTPNILAAIERVADPNQDGDMSDKLDVVNMSLGSDNGDPDDAMSVAVDNAVKLGITFCISAGNNGNAESLPGEQTYYTKGFETIGSPGTSRLAITVGAIDSVNKLAYFSSKGPAAKTFGIKPDVVAPGYNIKSLALNGGYAYHNGASMASPMVAGVVALMKSYNKNLTPAQIKSALVNHAVDLGLQIMHQGGGKVDAIRAIEATTFSIPVSINFDVDNPALANWAKTETLKVQNTKLNSQSYQISFSGNTSGITLSAVPQNFTLASGEMQNIIVTITVNNAVIPLKNEDILLYGGFVHLNGNNDTVHVPWSFARTSRMVLSFSEANAKFFGVSNGYYISPYYNKSISKVRWLDSKTIEVIGAYHEQYDLAVYFPLSNRLVMKEAINFTGAENFPINSSDAVHTVSFNGIDNVGVPFNNNGKTIRNLKINLPLGYSYYVTLPEGSSTVFASSASANFSFHPSVVHNDQKYSHRIFIPQFKIFNGINKDITVTNDNTSYIKQTMRLKFPPNTSKAKLYADLISIENRSGDETFGSYTFTIDTIDVQNSEYSFDLYLMKPVDQVYSNSAAFAVNYSDLTSNFVDYMTRYFSIKNDSIVNGLSSQSISTTYKSANNGTMEFGNSPVHILNVSYNNSFGPSIHFRPLFFGPLDEQRYSDGNVGIYRIFNEAGEKLKEDKLNITRTAFPVPPGKNRLEIESQNYFVKNAKGKITLVNQVNTTMPVPDAPYITSYKLLNSTKNAVDNFKKNENAELQFSSKIFSFPFQLPVTDSTKVFYRKYKSNNWMPLSVTSIGNYIDNEGTVFAANLNELTKNDSSAYDLRIRIVDQYGNAAEQILSPAFSVGNWLDDSSTGVDPIGAIYPKEFSLMQNYPNPFNPVTTIMYDVPFRSEVEIAVFDILGRYVSSLTKQYHEAGSYKVAFDGSHLSSGIYFYRMQAGNFVATKKLMLLK